MRDIPPAETLEAARKWCAKEFRKRYRTYMGHSSHLAEKILEEASKKFELKDFGVEGFCNKTGTKGVHYLNYGDPYYSTICALCTGTRARFTHAKGGWSVYVNGAFSP